MELRLLNGSHSALAYLGYLAGVEHVYETMRIPAFVEFVRRLMHEDAAPTLSLRANMDLAQYQETLIARFVNPALKHRCWQIVMDETQKLPQRLLQTARERLADGATCEHVALAVAAWIRYVTGVDEHDAPIDVRDPLASRLAAVARGAGTDVDAIVHGYLAVREVFGDDLPHAQPFVRSVSRWLRGLYEHGAHATLEAAYGGAKKR